MARIETLQADQIVVDEEPYIYRTQIPGVIIVKRPFYEDSRGAFQEVSRIGAVSSAIGVPDIKIRQSQISQSVGNVLRGIHAEPTTKIVTPLLLNEGQVHCIIVDLRPDSESFTQHVDIVVGYRQFPFESTTIVIPEGCGNSFCVVSGEKPSQLLYMYMQTQEYDPLLKDCGVSYADPQLAIDWPSKLVEISQRDLSLPALDDFLEKYREHR